MRAMLPLRPVKTLLVPPALALLLLALPVHAALYFTTPNTVSTNCASHASTTYVEMAPGPHAVGVFVRTNLTGGDTLSHWTWAVDPGGSRSVYTHVDGGAYVAEHDILGSYPNGTLVHLDLWMNILSPGGNYDYRCSLEQWTYDAPLAPTLLSVTSPILFGYLQTAHLVWSAPADQSAGRFVEGYDVYRSLTPDGPYEKLTSYPVGETEFWDAMPAPGQFWYKVVSVNDGGSGAASAAMHNLPSLT
jgi:hypothetical protein